MSVDNLFNIPMSDIDWRYWSFANQDHHSLVNQAILSSTGVTLPLAILDPIPQDDIQNWLLRHQDLHNQQDARLGIAGQDFSIVDFRDRRQLEVWAYLHGVEHYQMATKTGAW